MQIYFTVLKLMLFHKGDIQTVKTNNLTLLDFCFEIQATSKMKKKSMFKTDDDLIVGQHL